MDECHPYYNCIRNDPRYDHGPSACDFPMTESLKLTKERTLPFWNSVIVPQIKCGKNILIVAHGNSLRGICKHLDQISDCDIPKLELPTGIPFLYILDDNMKPIPGGSLKYLRKK